MAVVQLPGWWDSLAPNVMPAVQNIQRMINPNYFANQDLKAAMQKNPEMISQLSNMSPEERATYAQTLGFKNGYNPFGSLPEGLDLKEKKKKIALDEKAQALDPEGFLAAKTGIRTSQKKQSEDLTIKGQQQALDLGAYDIDSKTMDNASKKIVLAERTRAQAKLEAAREKYPNVDFGRVTSELMNGKGQISPDVAGMLQVIAGDEPLTKALDTIISSQRFNKETQQQRDLAFLGHGFRMQEKAVDKNDQTQHYRDQFLTNAVEGARKEYQAANQDILKLTSSNLVSKYDLKTALESSPEFKTSYDEAVTRRNDAKKTFDTYRPEVAKTLGIVIPDVDSPPEPPGMDANPNVVKVLKNIQAGKIKPTDIDRITGITEQERNAIKARLPK